VLVKDVMGRLVVPELQSIRELLPRIYQRMRRAKKVDVVLAIDNSGRQTFAGQSLKLEQAVIKLVLPGIIFAQQSCALAIPILFMEGTETSLQQELGVMIGKSLRGEVSVATEDGQVLDTFKVHWHLSGDHKRVTLLAGFGVSGTNKPCFLCPWDCTAAFAATGLRSETDILSRAAWANDYLKPLHIVQATVKKAATAVNESKKTEQRSG
jgi:hypothetical protein